MHVAKRQIYQKLTVDQRDPQADRGRRSCFNLLKPKLVKIRTDSVKTLPFNEDFECNICLMVVWEEVVCNKCKKINCATCVSQLKETKQDNCPNCRNIHV